MAAVVFPWIAIFKAKRRKERTLPFDEFYRRWIERHGTAGIAKARLRRVIKKDRATCGMAGGRR